MLKIFKILYGTLLLHNPISQLEYTKDQPINIINPKIKADQIPWDDADLSQLKTGDEWNDWISKKEPVDITKMNLNINIYDINDEDDGIKQFRIYQKIAEALDNKYQEIEETTFGYLYPNMFSDQVTSQLFFFENISISVQRQLTRDPSFNVPINDPDKTFSIFKKMLNNQISSFDLRISNKQSTDWKTNKSYFDVSLNICNFDVSNGSQVMNSADLGILNTQKNGSNKHNDRVGLTTPWKTFHVSDFCKEFKDIKTAEFFLKPSQQFTYHFNIYAAAEYQQHYPNQTDTRNNEAWNINLDNIERVTKTITHDPQDAHGGLDVATNVFSQGFKWGHAWTAGYNDIGTDPSNKNDPECLYISGSIWTEMIGQSWYTYYFNFTYTGLNLWMNFNSELFKNSPTPSK